ncbi:MAG: hypothetical protein RL297_733 [Pseudomonadota bacterium]|jgi:cytoskeleton protein RodZ
MTLESLRMSDNPTSPSVSLLEPLMNGHLLLSQARQAAGVSLETLSHALKVPVKRLELLEAGCYEALPDTTFARALAMGVCRHLSMDPQPVLARMPSAHVPNLGTKEVLPGSEMYTTSEGLTARPVSVFRRPPVLIALALLLAAAMLYHLPEESEKMPLAVKENVDSPSKVEAPVDTPPEPLVPQVPPVAVQPEPTAVLRVGAQDDTWLEVIRPDGTVLLSRLLKTGEVVDMGSAPPYTVVLGRASVAQVFVRGQPIALAPHTRGDVARYEVK